MRDTYSKLHIILVSNAKNQGFLRVNSKRMCTGGLVEDTQIHSDMPIPNMLYLV